MRTDTIAAIATPQGMGGVCVIRVSGIAAVQIAQRLGVTQLRPRVACLSTFLDSTGAGIDEGIVLYFAAPHSFTGEDVVEFQGHGGITVAQCILQACLDAGARLAEPGEFAQRAFLNNKIDLAQAEAIADLITARSQTAVRAANRALQGAFSMQVTALADELLQLRMIVEASLDFSDEEIDIIDIATFHQRLQTWGAQLGDLLENCRQGQLINEGANLVLVGKPNAGKSSLLNALLGESRAIVTNEPGTTRDIVRGTIIVEGIPVNILDTAGLRESDNVVEQAGIQRTHEAIKQADIVVQLVDGTSYEQVQPLVEAQAKVLVVYNKADLVAPSQRIPARWISAQSGEGIPELKQNIAQVLGKTAGDESLFIARERHIRALQRCHQYYMAALSYPKIDEFLADDLRLAHDALGEITGKVSTDDLLGEIFAGFCIGK